MLAEMDVSGLLSRHTSWKWSPLFNIFISLTVGFLFLESDVSLGKPTYDFLRSLQINGDGKFGVDFHYYDENISVLVISFTILFVIDTTNLLKKVFSTSFPVFMGRISFSMYLFHRSIIIDSLSNQLMDVNSSQGRYPNVLISFIVLFFVSEILTVFIDHPSVDFARWVEKGLLGDWKVNEVISSAPYWPRGVISYIYGRFKICVLSFISMLPTSLNSRLRSRNESQGEQVNSEIENAPKELKFIDSDILPK